MNDTIPVTAVLGVLPDDVRATLRSALEDAIEYREPGECVDCHTIETGDRLCADHVDDVVRASQYDALLTLLARGA